MILINKPLIIDICRNTGVKFSKQHCVVFKTFNVKFNSFVTFKASFPKAIIYHGWHSVFVNT